MGLHGADDDGTAVAATDADLDALLTGRDSWVVEG